MRFSRYTQWRSEKFGAVIFDTLNEKVYVTNETGNDILRLVEECPDAGAVAARLGEIYDSDSAEIAADVAAFVGELQAGGLVAADSEDEE